MTKSVIKIRKYPKEYKFDIEKLKEKLGEVAYLSNDIRISEDFEYFNDVKHLLIILEESKSLEKIQQEFHEKIDELIEQTKRNFYASNLTAERKYHDFCDRQDSAFEYMQKNGCPPLKYVIDYSQVPYLNSGIILSDTPLFEIKPTGSIGYYEISSGFYFWMKQKPSKVVRIMSRFLLGWIWKDT